MSDSSTLYTQYQGNTHLFGSNAPYVEEMYENYLADPTSVPDGWRSYFDSLQNQPAADGSLTRDVPHLPVINAFAERARQGHTQVVVASGADTELGRKRTAVQQLIAAYRNVGQRWADLDPLKRNPRPHIPERGAARAAVMSAGPEAADAASGSPPASLGVRALGSAPPGAGPGRTAGSGSWPPRS